MGYSWSNAYFRVVPQDGTAATIRLSTAFAWCGGALKIDVTPEVEQINRETIDRALLTETLGYRYKIALTFAIGGNMSDHAALAAILSALSRSDADVYLSLDGSTERKVVLSSPGYGPIKPFNGKPFAGAEFTLTVETSPLEDSIAPIGSGVL